MLVYRILLLLFLILSCHSYHEDNQRVEIYFTARNAKRGIIDNGVYHYSLSKKSVKVAYNERSYDCVLKKDSVYELFYLDTIMSDKEINEIFRYPHLSVDSFWNPRAMIVFNNHEDTLIIDRNLTGYCSSRDICIKLPIPFSQKLFTLLPTELSDSWVKDMPPRTNTTPR